MPEFSLCGQKTPVFSLNVGQSVVLSKVIISASLVVIKIGCPAVLWFLIQWGTEHLNLQLCRGRRGHSPGSMIEGISGEMCRARGPGSRKLTKHCTFSLVVTQT